MSNLIVVKLIVCTGTIVVSYNTTFCNYSLQLDTIIYTVSFHTNKSVGRYLSTTIFNHIIAHTLDFSIFNLFRIKMKES